jgi:hypothetical protein
LKARQYPVIADFGLSQNIGEIVSTYFLPFGLCLTHIHLATTQLGMKDHDAMPQPDIRFNGHYSHLSAFADLFTGSA